tara:strand:+ start:505 stop:993 length:489 start_codon:yes stop_codon:yes gene_type:complete
MFFQNLTLINFYLKLKAKVEFIENLKSYIKIIFVIMLILIGTVTNSKNVFADDIEKFASKLFNHYEYDDKISNYLKSFFSFGKNGVKNSSDGTINNTKTNLKKQKTSIKLKSKNKLIYNFENGQSIQINPSNLGEKLTYNSSKFTFFEIKKDSVSYGFNIDF